VGKCIDYKKSSTEKGNSRNIGSRFCQNIILASGEKKTRLRAQTRMVRPYHVTSCINFSLRVSANDYPVACSNGVGGQDAQRKGHTALEQTVGQRAAQMV
jgi:hypothetical protein